MTSLADYVNTKKVYCLCGRVFEKPSGEGEFDCECGRKFENYKNDFSPYGYFYDLRLVKDIEEEPA